MKKMPFLILLLLLLTVACNGSQKEELSAIPIVVETVNAGTSTTETLPTLIISLPPTNTPPILQCTPPACLPGENITCPSGDCPGGCGSVCTRPEQVIQCTPPACQPGEIYACGADSCPGGCGTICVQPEPHLELDPVKWRHHKLYEANNLFEQKEFEQALFAYEAVVNNETLEVDTLDGRYNAAEIYDDLAKFAAFRLILIDLQNGDEAKAQLRRNWLDATYPQSAAAVGAGAILQHWQETHSLKDSCLAGELAAQVGGNPTGVLVELGTSLPVLDGDSLCPWVSDGG